MRSISEGFAAKQIYASEIGVTIEETQRKKSVCDICWNPGPAEKVF